MAGHFGHLEFSFAWERACLSHSITPLRGTMCRTLDDEHSRPANWKFLHCTGYCLQWTATRVDRAPSIKDFSANVDTGDCAALTAAPRASSESVFPGPRRYLSCASTAAFAASSRSTTSQWPFSAAKCSGVWPQFCWKPRRQGV